MQAGLCHLRRRILARKYGNADAKRLSGTDERELLVVDVLFNERAEIGREFLAVHDPKQSRDGPVRPGRLPGRQHAIRRQQKPILAGEYVELHGAENTAAPTHLKVTHRGLAAELRSSSGTARIAGQTAQQPTSNGASPECPLGVVSGHRVSNGSYRP